MRDPLGIVPPDIRVRYEREEWVERGTRAARALESALKALDPHLSVVLVKHNADPEILPGGCIPGRWHVKRDNPPPAMPTYLAILGENGGYREPDFGVVDELRKLDLQRPGALREATKQPDKTKARELRAEQRRDALKEDLRAAKRVAGDGGLRQVRWGKGREAKKK